MCSGLGCGWGTGFGWRGEDEASADHGEALLGELGLEKLVFGAGKKVCGCSVEGGFQMVDGDGLAIAGSMFVSVGGELDGDDGAGFLGDDGPQAAITVVDREGQQSVICAGIKVGQEDGSGVGIEARGGAAAVGRDVDEEMSLVARGYDVDGGVVDGGAQLDVLEVIGRGEMLGFGDVVVEALHGEANDGGGVVALRRGGEGDLGGADGLAVLGDDETAGLAVGRGIGKYEQAG